MMIGMRSNSEPALYQFEEEVLRRVRQAAQEENKRWNSDAITVHSELVGNRPAGSRPSDAIIVRQPWPLLKPSESSLTGSSQQHQFQHTHQFRDPAVTLGGGGQCGGLHTLQEFSIPPMGTTVSKSPLTVLGLVGVKDVSDPLLKPTK